MPVSITYERRAAVGIVTLNRPEVLNALDSVMRRELPDAIREAEADSEVRAIVITGAGERAFCAGADIGEFTRSASVTDSRRERLALRWNDIIEATTKATIAAIRGYCLGGGLEIALACDVRIASSDAVFALPEVRLGMIPGAGGTQRLTRLVGVGAALRLILTGDQIDAAAALSTGLVAEVVAPESVLDSALDWAARLSRGGPLAIAYAKEAIRRGAELPQSDGLRLEDDLATLLSATSDRVEGLAAFRERRAPEFKGR